jgi:hypothetical protein
MSIMASTSASKGESLLKVIASIWEMILCVCPQQFTIAGPQVLICPINYQPLSKRVKTHLNHYLDKGQLQGLVIYVGEEATRVGAPQRKRLITTVRSPCDRDK